MYIHYIYKTSNIYTLYYFYVYICEMKKEKQLPIRVSVEEKEAFERAAEISGVGLSAWARQNLRRAAIDELQKVGETPEFLKQKPK